MAEFAAKIGLKSAGAICVNVKTSRMADSASYAEAATPSSRQPSSPHFDGLAMNTQTLGASPSALHSSLAPPEERGLEGRAAAAPPPPSSLAAAEAKLAPVGPTKFPTKEALELP